MGSSATTCWSTLALALVVGVWWLLYRTRFGLRLRAVGENPHDGRRRRCLRAASLRYAALTLNGVLCGLAGAYLDAGAERLVRAQHDRRPRLHGAGRTDLRQLAAGAGAARPACCSASSTPRRSACRASSLPGSWARVPVQAIQALPYLLTVILLAGFIGKQRWPRKALGLPYVKER